MNYYWAIDGSTTRSIALFKEDLLAVLDKVLSLCQGLSLTLSWRHWLCYYKGSLLWLVNTIWHFHVDWDQLVLPISRHCRLGSSFSRFQTRRLWHICLLLLILTDTNLYFLSHVLVAIIRKMSWVTLQLHPRCWTFGPLHCRLSYHRTWVFCLDTHDLYILVCNIPTPVRIAIFDLKFYVTFIIFLHIHVYILFGWLLGDLF